MRVSVWGERGVSVKGEREGEGNGRGEREGEGNGRGEREGEGERSRGKVSGLSTYDAEWAIHKVSIKNYPRDGNGHY